LIGDVAQKRISGGKYANRELSEQTINIYAEASK
jgi:hypothetical protein